MAFTIGLTSTRGSAAVKHGASQRLGPPQQKSDMTNASPQEQRDALHHRIWQIANEVRGAMDGSDFRLDRPESSFRVPMSHREYRSPLWASVPCKSPIN